MTEAKDGPGGSPESLAGSSVTFQNALEKAAGTTLCLDDLSAPGTLIGRALRSELLPRANGSCPGRTGPGPSRGACRPSRQLQERRAGHCEREGALPGRVAALVVRPSQRMPPRGPLSAIGVQYEPLPVISTMDMKPWPKAPRASIRTETSSTGPM